MKRWADAPQTSNDGDFNSITIGFVVDTNDPQQNGRVRAVCPALGDSTSPNAHVLEDIPWAQYLSPFGGVVDENLPRGPLLETDTEKEGPLSYGFWSPPRVGAQVLVMCIDGDPQYRVYIGCINIPHTVHTLPHGRYSYNIPTQNGQFLDGPYSSSETPIQPLYDNITKSFTSSNPLGSNGRESIEWLSRGADYTASALDNQNITTSFSNIADDKDHEVSLQDGSNFNKRQGYNYDRINPQQRFKSTGSRYDNSVHSWNTPGFHAISMDDRPENCRMRFRTTTGHQIILDDSNERIYVSTAEGKNWIEMDQQGNVDVYAERKISIHSDSDININAAENIRMNAKNIHLNTSNELRAFSSNDLHLKTNGNFRIFSNDSFYIHSLNEINLLSNSAMKITSNNTLDIKSSDVFTSEASMVNISSSTINLSGTTNGSFNGNITGQAGFALTAGLATPGAPSPISIAGPSSVSASTASSSETITANLTTRKPLHEPWPRISYNLNLTDVSDPSSIPSHVLEHDVNSFKVNVEDHGTEFNRNPYWLR